MFYTGCVDHTRHQCHTECKVGCGGAGDTLCLPRACERGKTCTNTRCKNRQLGMQCVHACNTGGSSIYYDDGYNCIKCHDQCSGCNGLVSSAYD